LGGAHPACLGQIVDNQVHKLNLIGSEHLPGEKTVECFRLAYDS
jgi:hypothetical protein